MHQKLQEPLFLLMDLGHRNKFKDKSAIDKMIKNIIKAEN